MTGDEPQVAGIELGGTKCIAVLARGRQILERAQWPTTGDAGATLALIARWLEETAARHPLAAVGIGSFGPLCLDPADPGYGTITRTPKAGWSGAPVLAGIAGGCGLPVGFDTDVAGAALAEGRWGAAAGCTDHVYLTIGTGIGGGVIVNGLPLHGSQHPELGHVRVRRAAGDDFAGTCPFHGDCLEGLASGPAIAARAGRSADVLPPGHPVWDRVAAELAELMAMLILTLAPQRIVVGGGVGAGQPALLARIREHTAALLGNYPAEHDASTLASVIVAPGLGGDAGVHGAVALALNRLELPG